MNEIPLWILFSLIAFLVLMSAFFSGSETGMMAINRYRLKHLVQEKNKSAKRVSKLLERTDRLLGVILIGNNFTHTLATALATVIAIRIWSDNAVLAVTVFMTIVMIIFAEVMPKTIAALKPESVALPASHLLKPLSKVLSPLITLVSFVSNGTARLFGIDLDSANKDELKPEELRTLLQTSGVPKRQEEMLMGIFDMDNLSVNDVMIPKNEIIGIDINDSLDSILNSLQEIDFTYIPCYEDSIDNILGFLSLNKKADFLVKGDQSKDSLKEELQDPLFVPENTALYKQLTNFQSTGRRVGVIVDEYGDIEGIITLRSILEVIVGEISESMEKMDILPQADGTFLIEGGMMIRDINRRLKWDLPTEGPKTLSGLILEEIQTIPDTNVGLTLEGYRLETVLIKENVIKLAKLEKIEVQEDLDEEQE
ncbi:MAG: magnesium/cobalt efflux protein [Gammaproteobacteria bacterium]|nr:magnesium/cobalt efflux protein [Gammaproteobacteria bacterium]MBS66627.1 magnesium/cobalt efflux protein [Gammaproteobacteria bacterium]